MKKFGKFAAALVVMAAAIGMLGCAQPSGGGNNAGSGNGGSPTGYTATYQFTESVVPLTGAENTGTNGTNSNYVLFGDFPQSEAASGITFNKTPESNGYYVGSDGNYYAKVTVEKTNNEYTAGDVKYFKVEPIKWRVLDTEYDYDGENGTQTAKLLLAENILTANVPFYEDYENNRTIASKTIYPNNYEHSQIRAYLNGLTYQGQSAAVSTWNGKGFLQTAFTAAAQAEIKITVVNNKEGSTKNYHKDGETDIPKATTYACDNTNDKIFLLSEYEVTKYSTEKYTDIGSGNSRIRKTTPYARANNAYQSSTNGYGGGWWLRSPNFDRSNLARHVDYDGDASYSYYVSITYYGVVPALSIAF